MVIDGWRLSSFRSAESVQYESAKVRKGRKRSMNEVRSKNGKREVGAGAC